jgi:hypothetical protein
MLARLSICMPADASWLLEHAEVTRARRDFVWEYWTDVAHWDDPPASFRLDGPFASGSRGTTVIPDRDPLHWVLRNVQPGVSYTIESALEGAVLLCQWSFEALPDQGTRIRQRIGVAGPAAAQHLEAVRQGFGPTLPQGMRRIADLLAEASAGVEEAMTKRRVGEWLVGGTSLLIFLSAFAHALPGWSGLREALQARTEPALLTAVGIGWHFGSVSMATFGLLGMRGARLLRRGHGEARSTPLVIGGMYALFGAGALVVTDMRPHFLFFVVLGLLLLAGAGLWSPPGKDRLEDPTPGEAGQGVEQRTAAGDTRDSR